jgi:molybdopterin converting factor small subunit
MTETVTVRIFGSLRPLRESRGLPVTLEAAVPAAGCTGRELAESLELPPEEIEGVFVNHKVYALSHPVMPGDRVAFVPYDTPGPHRVFLGLYSAGKEEEGEGASSAADAATSGDAAGSDPAAR